MRSTSFPYLVPSTHPNVTKALIKKSNKAISNVLTQREKYIFNTSNEVKSSIRVENQQHQ
jgi:hypothetical protein